MGLANDRATRLAFDMTPDEYCQNKAAQSGSSFYYSFRFLPPDRRRAITALYAFCREVDDVADEVSDVDVARVKLGILGDELGGQRIAVVIQRIEATGVEIGNRARGWPVRVVGWDRAAVAALRQNAHARSGPIQHDLGAGAARAAAPRRLLHSIKRRLR